MRLASIASGSSGNCTYIGTDDTHLLIDDGIAGKKVAEALRTLEIAPEDLAGILMTHEHRDHIAGLGILSRRYHLPIYGTGATLDEIRRSDAVGQIDGDLFHPIEAERDFTVGDLNIHPFPVPHDAACPVAYRLESGGKSAAVVTDLGEYDERIVGELEGLDTVLVEANHDVRMLQVGPYPYELKCRILSSRGHLCNEAAGRLLDRILHDGTEAVLLGHLSAQNNYPDLALETVKLEITMGECPYKASDFRILIAERNRPGPCIIW